MESGGITTYRIDKFEGNNDITRYYLDIKKDQNDIVRYYLDNNKNAWDIFIYRLYNIPYEEITYTDVVRDNILQAPNYKMFLGTSTGSVHKHEATQYSDHAETMRCVLYTKTLDFTDQYPEYNNLWKTVYKVRLYYVDKDADTDVSVHLSNDGGQTWIWKTRTIGTGDGKAKTADFDFIETGQYFTVKLEHVSADKRIEWIGLEVMFKISGEHFEIS